jgi:lipopolysaccharide transport system permease protein
MEHSGKTEQAGWDLVIRPKKGFLDIRPADLWHYRDLLFLLVRRDIITVYKQTLLGFFWFIIPPVLNALTYLVIFGIFARVDTGTSNKVLFYLGGVIAWGFLADCTNRTSGTFRANASVFGKVYFPRLIVPLSSVVSALFKFFVQLGFFLLVMVWFTLSGESIDIQWQYIWLIPVVLLMMGLTGLAFGITISALTTKYRDLSNIVPFALQLLMYITPVVYPYTFFPEKIRWIFDWNPISPLIEIFRFVMIGSDRLDFSHLLYCAGFSLTVLIIGLILFNRTEQTFMDTV